MRRGMAWMAAPNRNDNHGARRRVGPRRRAGRRRGFGRPRCLIATFELSMADWPSGFVLLLILPLTALLFFGCCSGRRRN